MRNDRSHNAFSFTNLCRLALTTSAVMFKETSAARPAQHRPSDLFSASVYRESIGHLVVHRPGDTHYCLVDQHMPADRKVAEASTQNHERYAERHGYLYYSFEGRLSGKMFVDPKHRSGDEQAGGGLRWQKFSALAAAAVDSYPDGPLKCGWLMWIDNDAVFTNPSFALETIVDSFAEKGDSVAKDIILSRDSWMIEHNLINSGVFMVKNSPMGRNFLQQVADLFVVYQDSFYQDQQAFHHHAIGRDTRHLNSSQMENLGALVRPDIAVAPPRTMTSLVSFASVNHLESQWQPCDLIIQLPKLSTAVRIDNIKEVENPPLACMFWPSW
ncbi:MAG: hypothetical protein EOO40_01475 [Deltaproteobacteria bacterium]|nr:MAG: hypothetical protein EOO40_01475 [Deltaproteobacteria bacterium]